MGEGGGGRRSGFILTGTLFNWHVQVFYILTIDTYKRLYCNRQLPGNECVSLIIAIIQFSPVSYINKYSVHSRNPDVGDVSSCHAAVP